MALLVRRAIGAARAGRQAHEVQNRRQTDLAANQAAGTYVEAGLINISGQEWAHEQLRIPVLQLNQPSTLAPVSGNAARSLSSAKLALQHAEQTYAEALSCAGLSDSSLHTTSAALQGFTPILSSAVHRASSGRTKNMDKGQQHLQETEAALRDVGVHLTALLLELQLQGSMQGPRSPLAMTELLDIMSANSAANFFNSSHPVIVVLYNAEVKSHLAGSEQHARRRKGPRQGPITQLINAGADKNPDTTAMGQAIMDRVAVADLLELQRLALQLDQLSKLAGPGHAQTQV